MKRLIISSVLLTSLWSGNVFVNSGWNLMGAMEDMNVSNLNSNCIMSLWTYNANKENKWSAYVKGFSSDKLLSYGIDTLKTIPKGKGYWVLALNDNCEIKSNYNEIMDNNATNLEKTLAKVIFNGSKGMSIAGQAAQSGANGIGSNVDNLDNISNYKTLYNITPTFYVNNNNGKYEANLTIPDIDVTANLSMGFSVDGNNINASYVLDNTGEAYGLGGENGLSVVMQKLSEFFTGLQNSNNQTSYIVNNVSEIINYITKLTQKPLFSIVGNDDLQNFFKSFPKNINECYSADWTDLGNKFSNLGNELQNNSQVINFDKINYDLSIDFDKSVTMNDILIVLPTLYATGTLKPLVDGNYSMNFKSKTNGTIMVNDEGVSGNISNVEINTTASGIIGKYDLAVSLGDGHTYTGTGYFNELGCQGADIYDENQNLIIKMKSFDDGLYIVDQNGTKKEKLDF